MNPVEHFKYMLARTHPSVAKEVVNIREEYRIGSSLAITSTPDIFP